ncbi:MAG: hypothetical protein DRP51_07800 [Candidatus Zixiibacteriota bacterium]|nr:MAG: hypothetical protein DRP51_07800 [candidate division Zixibacteria bacterium]
MKILIVEDDDVSRKLVDSILTKNNYETLLASSVQEAITFLKSNNHVSLIILDIMMPDEDGYSLLKYLNRQESISKIPVLMCSAVGDKFSVIHSASLGAADYIRKPIESELLLAKIRDMLNKGNKTVLIVDDEEMIRNLLKNTLEREKYDVLTADSGVTALKVLASNRINVVISDIQMSNMDGFELLVQIKSHYPDVPVLMITGQLGKYNKDDAMLAGADGYIAKPFKNLDIIKTLQDILGKCHAH